VDKHRRAHGSHTEVGLPEVVGFALGAGVMAKALTALEAGLSGSERARRLARDGIRAEFHRMVGDRVPTPRTAATTTESASVPAP